MVETIMRKLTAPETIMEAMRESLQQIDPQYEKEHQSFQEGIRLLRDTLGDNHAVSLDTFLAEEERSMAESLLYLFWKGVKQNYDCFANPVNKLFMQLDYEDIHQEDLMKSFLPATYDDLGRKLVLSLPDELKVLTDPITSYYAYLQTVAYKLAHYYGFHFADRFLPQVVPGYYPDQATTTIYGSMLSEDLNLKMLRYDAILSD